MGQFDYLVPGSTAKAPTSTGPVGGQFASLVPSQNVPDSTYKAAADFANSPEGLAVNTAKAFGSKILESGRDAVTGLANTYESFVPQVTSQVESGANDITQGDVLKGAAKAVLGTAGTFAGAVYAPIGAAIGALLQATGGQKLMDDTGQVIADKSGITDIPAFQKFAMAHPNAGTYFQQTMNLVLGGADDGKIMESGAKTAKALVDSAAKPAESSSLIKLPVSGESVEKPIPITNDYRLGPDIPAGPTPKDTSGLPSIQIEAPTPDGKLPGYKVEPVTSTPAPVAVPDVSASTAEVTTPTKTAASSVENAPVTPTDIPTKGALDISANLVKSGEAVLTPDEMASYKSGSYKDSAATAETLKAQDPEALKQMAITGKGIPEGVFPKILYNLVEKDAIESKDYALQRELARSPLNTEASTHAGQLGAGGYNAVKDSPVKVIKEAIEKKAGGAKGKEKIAAEAKKAKSTITKSAKQMMDYKSILDSIKTC